MFGVVLCSAFVALTAVDGAESTVPENIVFESGVDAAEVLPLWLGGNLEQAREKHIVASPLHWVTPAAAPTLILHGIDDEYVAYEQGVCFPRQTLRRQANRPLQARNESLGRSANPRRIRLRGPAASALSASATFGLGSVRRSP